MSNQVLSSGESTTTDPGSAADLSERPRTRAKARSILALILFLVIAYAVAALGTLTTISNVDGWYAHVFKAAWNPPNTLFGPVWTVLYALMAVAAWRVWRRRDAILSVAPALTVYVVQLILNALWTPLFFGGYPGWGPAALWIAFVVIVLLDVAVAVTMAAFMHVDRVAGWLLLPYLVWVLFATTLNWALAALNS